MTEVKDREQYHPWTDAPAAIPPALISGRTLTHRRRLIRLLGALTFVGGIGLSAIPGPKASAHTVTPVSENGVTSEEHKFSYYRPVGFPFPAGQITLSESGEALNVNIRGPSVLGNFAVSFLLAFAGILFAGRKRRS